MKPLLSILLFTSVMSFTVSAHEYWFEPINFKIKVNEKLRAHEKVGFNFKGNEYAYLSSSYERFDITVGDETRPIKSRLGDLPAVNESIDKEGLVILSAITTDSELIYKTKDKFETFLHNQGLDWVKERHKARGLPEKGFRENYRRYPKSLIKVGHGKGNDKVMGLPLELVLETNPYTVLAGPIKAQLLWEGKPLSNKQVNIFNRAFENKNEILAGSKLIESYLITDSEGYIEIPRASGGIFLVSAVHMIEPKTNTKTKAVTNNSNVQTAVWESLWASITYKVDKNSN